MAKKQKRQKNQDFDIASLIDNMKTVQQRSENFHLQKSHTPGSRGPNVTIDFAQIVVATTSIKSDINSFC